MADRHLAQFNVAHLAHPLEHPQLAPFVDSLEAVNAVADAAPGFAWRMLDESSGNATSLRPWGEDWIINLSVWHDLDSLRAYVYGAAHAEILRQRRAFFTPIDTAGLALWWVEVGHRPSLDEASARLDHLDVNGPTPYAFTLRDTFAPDSIGA